MVTLAEIREAAARLEPYIDRTPAYNSDVLRKRASNHEGCEIWLKLENLQLTQSFKVRGALNKVLKLGRDYLARRGIITASAGNHAQGVGYASRLLEVQARTTIYMPENTPETKRQRTSAYGVNIMLHGSTYDEAKREAEKHAEAERAVYIPAFDDNDVMAGQGTIGLELDAESLDAVIVPVGGGGLISGVAVALKNQARAIGRTIKVIGVEPVGAHCGIHARRNGRPTPLPQLGETVADGVRVQTIGQKCFESMTEENVDAIYAVTDQSIKNAMLFLVAEMKLVAEGAGAIGVALLLDGQVDPYAWLTASADSKPSPHPIADLARGSRVAVVVSGGNVDLPALIRTLEAHTASV